MELETVLIYAVIAVLAIGLTLLLLLLIKIPVVVGLIAGLLAAALTLLYAQLEAGHADPFALLAFVATAIYAMAVSFITLWIGRALRWSLFVDKPADRA